MHVLKSSWIQLLIVLAIGATAGLTYRLHRQADEAWHATHYRKGETFPIPKRTVYAESPYLQETDGTKWFLPIEGGLIDWCGAEWFTLEDTGRMRYFDADRDEVFPSVEDAE